MPGRCPDSQRSALPPRSPAPAAASPRRQPSPSPQASAPQPGRPPPAVSPPVVPQPTAQRRHPAGWLRSYSPSARMPRSDKPDTERSSRRNSRTTEPLPNPTHRPPEPPTDCKPIRKTPGRSNSQAHIRRETRRGIRSADSSGRNTARGRSKCDARIRARGTYKDAGRTRAHAPRRRRASDRRDPPAPPARHADRDERSCRDQNHGTRRAARRRASSSPSREVPPRCDYPPVTVPPSLSSAKRSCWSCGRRDRSKSWCATSWSSSGRGWSS